MEAHPKLSTNERAISEGFLNTRSMC